MYLHEFHLSRFVIFSVCFCLSLHLQIMNLFLQRLLSEHSFISFPLTLPHVLLPEGQLKQNGSTYINLRNY